MELLTTGKKNTNRKEPICVMQISPFEIEEIIPDRLRIILVQNDSGIIEIDSKPVPFISPSVFCISEQEKISKLTLNHGAVILYFHPGFISKSINLPDIYKPGNECNEELRSNRLLFWPFINRDIPSKGIYNVSEPTALRIKQLMLSINDELTEQSTGWWPCRSRSYLSELLFLVSQLPQQAFETDTLFVDNAPREIQPILTYLYNNYSRKISISDIAKEFYTNRTTLNENFKKYSGLTIISFLIKLRLRIAAFMIKDTELPLSEIIHRVGFEDFAHFSRLFKKQYDKAPSEFRKMVL